MLIDIFASLFLSLLLYPITGGYTWIVLFGALALFFIMWLMAIIRLGKNKSKGGMIAVIICGILCSFLLAWLVSMFISSDKIDDTERERELKLTPWNYWGLKLV